MTNEAERIATKLVLRWFQSWDQSTADRFAALREAAAYARLEVHLWMESDKSWRASSPKDSHWPAFYTELQACWPLWKVEDEIEAVKKLLMKFREICPEAQKE